MKILSYSACFKFGWETFKSRPWFFVGATFLIGAFNWGVHAIESLVKLAAQFGHLPAGEFAASLVSLALWTLGGMGIIAFTLKAHDDTKAVTYKDLWHPDQFWQFLGATIIVSVIYIVGFILLIVPGIIAITALLFTTYLVVDKNLNPIDAIKESIRITKGHRLALLGFILLVILMNILGAVLLLVGLLVSIPVTVLASAHAYRVLSSIPRKEEPAPPVPDVIDVTHEVIS